MPIPGFYVWEVPGKWISIELSLDVVDRLQQDVIRGFGSLPRRGAEVGGILLGTVSGGGRIVRVDDYHEVPIEYRRGPSYLLSEPDTKAFEAAMSQLRNNPASSARPIGYFRSQTRDGVGLADEDLDLVAKYFSDPETIILLVRPFGTKPSTAGFYFKEDAQFQSGPPLLEFPFRRRDLAPDDSTPAPARPERVARDVSSSRVRRAAAVAQHSEQSSVKIAEAEPAATRALPSEPETIAAQVPEETSRRSASWIWLPLSVVFLLVGVLAGFQAAMRVGPQALGGLDPYTLALTVTPAGSDLDVKWDRQSRAIRQALKGTLTIEDGDYRKPIELDADRLQGGSEVVYRHYSNHVRFRLEVFLKDSTSVAEAVDWKQ
ncbi:MAG TPA: hypothetical protein VH157_13105 [Bryobacteraceae bacterium]|nr:hypothetical protein [Bryobacteraceae bacterium]